LIFGRLFLGQGFEQRAKITKSLLERLVAEQKSFDFRIFLIGKAAQDVAQEGFVRR